jgi:hypothetical protein
MDNSKLPTTRQRTYTIHYLKKEPIANLVAVRAAYSWLSVDEPQIQYMQYRDNDTWFYANCTAAEATHFSVYPNNNDHWWNHYIYHESLQYKLDDLREYYADYGW